MSAIYDRKFVNLFTLVLGVLIGVAFAIYFLSAYVAHRTQSEQVYDSVENQRAVEERIAPVGKVAIAGHDNSALDAIGTAAAATTPATPPAELTGEQVYQSTCVACHGAGIAGAPKFGDKAAWAPHIAKGIDVLHKSALQGVQGAGGVMPPKGGRTDLPDQTIVKAVDYMVAAAK